MINLFLLFCMSLVLFAMIGYMRGWQKEVIALSGLVGAIAVLQQFGYEIVSFLGMVPVEGAGLEELADTRRQQIYVQAIFFVIIVFFSYQVVTRLAVSATGGRLGDRLRSGFERRIIGMFVGILNGYMVIGGLWSFLEYVPVPAGYERLLAGVEYPFDPTVIIRPAINTFALTFTEWLPLGIFSPTVWLILFFVTFFIVIVALV
jgi:uncharacterized membrane protein required for colicin V production